MGVRRLRARAFIGHSMRRLTKPGMHLRAHRARDGARLAVLRPAAAGDSAMYSQMASESHTAISPCFSTGTRPLGPVSGHLILELGRVEAHLHLLELEPRCFSSIHGRKDHEE